MNEYTGIICPHCGHETGIEPALVNPDDPMIYCPECDEPLFQIGELNLLNVEYRGENSHCKACEDEARGIKHIQAPKHTCKK